METNNQDSIINRSALVERLALEVFDEADPLNALDGCFGSSGEYNAYVGGSIAQPNEEDTRDVVIIESGTSSFSVSYMRQAIQQIGASGRSDLTDDMFLSVIAISGVADGTHDIGGFISPKETVDAYAIRQSCVDAYESMTLPEDTFRFAVFVDETRADAEELAARINNDN